MAMYRNIESLEDFENLIGHTPALLVYFSTGECSVCKVLKPKVLEMVSGEFPALVPVYAAIDVLPELAARYRIFTAPTLLLFFDGREYIRKSRSFGLQELRGEIRRLYDLMF